MKEFYVQYNIGKVKYAVSYHDGVQKHRDNSPFYGVEIFKNKKKMDMFIVGLEKEGYTER